MSRKMVLDPWSARKKIHRKGPLVGCKWKKRKTGRKVERGKGGRDMYKAIAIQVKLRMKKNLYTIDRNPNSFKFEKINKFPVDLIRDFEEVNFQGAIHFLFECRNDFNEYKWFQKFMISSIVHNFGWFQWTSYDSNNFYSISIRFHALSNSLREESKSTTEVSTNSIMWFLMIPCDFLWLHSWLQTQWFDDFTSESPLGNFNVHKRKTNFTM